MRQRELTSERRRDRAIWIRLGLLVVILVGAVVVAAVLGLPDVERLRADIAAAGPVAPALFVLLFGAMTLAPLPKNVLATVAGLLFGLWLGVVIVLLGALIGAMTAFMLGRLLGRDAVERVAAVRMARVDALLRRNGLIAVIGARLAPVVPFTAVSYGAGLTAIRTRDYAVGTAIGIIPGTVAYVALGSYGTAASARPIVVTVIAIAALVAGGAALGRCSRHGLADRRPMWRRAPGA